MRHLLKTIDRILRGELTTREELLKGRVQIDIRTLALCGLALGVLYGVFMGLYSALSGGVEPRAQQLVYTAVKVPLLFLLTLVVTFPSLYVFSALAGSRLHFSDTLRLCLVGIVLNLAMLASFGPVTGFFTLSTESYPFMIILNVVFFAIAGIAGLVCMHKGLDSVIGSKGRTPDETAGESTEADAGSVHKHTSSGGQPARGVFWAWTVIYGVVGAQMGWILRPFIGSPDMPVEIFRERQSNFFEALFEALGQLLSGG